MHSEAIRVAFRHEPCAMPARSLACDTPAPTSPRCSVEAADRPRSLDDLLVAVAGGDREAFSDLYDEVSGVVYGLAKRVVVDPSRAQEIAQDVLLEVWRKASGFDPDRGSAITWIAVMTRRRAIDVVRSSESSRAREEKVNSDPGDDPDPVSDVVVSLDERRRVRHAMRALSDLQREALELAFFEDMSHREVAEALGAPLGTVKTRIRDGLLNLAGQMEAWRG